MTVRRASMKDIRGILKLSEQWTDDGDSMDSGILEGYILDRMVYCIEDEGDVFGVMLLKENTDGSIHIGRLFVHEDHRDEGYGSELIESLLELIQTNRTAAFLTIAANHLALPFYKRHGFSETDSYKPPKEDQIALMYPAP